MIARPGHPFRLLLAALTVAGYAFLLAPIIVVVASSFGSSPILTFPPHGLSLRWYAQALRADPIRQGFQASMIVAGAAACLSILIGAPAALAIARRRFPGSEVVNALFLSPLVLPSIVLSVALLLYFSAARVGPSLPRLVGAHLVICVPYVLRTLIPVLQSLEPSLEEAAANLGARPLASFLLVTLPIIRAGVVSAALFAFIISFDEVVLALFIAPPRQQTLPIKIYAAIQFGLDPAVAAVSALLIALTFVVMALLQLTIGVRRIT